MAGAAEKVAEAGAVLAGGTSWHEDVFVDPQTSGGLLAAVAPDAAQGVLGALHDAGVADARRIGEVGTLDGTSRLLFR